jgi:DNA repair protein RadC
LPSPRRSSGGQSQDDIQITQNLCRCGEILGIEVTDSIIIGQDSFYSFKERGML